MHTEHLQNVRPGILFTGWLAGVGVTSLLVFMLEASGLAPFGPANNAATLLAVVIGFAVGGFFTGFVARRAPILHGVGLGILSIVAWVVVNALAALLGRPFDSGGLSVNAAIGLLFAQIIAAVPGALVGYNVVQRGKPGLREDVGPSPDD